MMCYSTPATAELLGQKQPPGVQSSRDEEISVYPAALRTLQDRVGLADPPLYLLHRCHGAVQRCIPDRTRRQGPSRL